MVENVLNPHFQYAKVLLVPQHQHEMHGKSCVIQQGGEMG